MCESCTNSYEYTYYSSSDREDENTTNEPKNKLVDKAIQVKQRDFNELKTNCANNIEQRHKYITDHFDDYKELLKSGDVDLHFDAGVDYYLDHGEHKVKFRDMNIERFIKFKLQKKIPIDFRHKELRKLFIDHLQNKYTNCSVTYQDIKGYRLIKLRWKESGCCVIM